MSEHGGSTPLVGFGDPDVPATFAYFHVEADAASGVYPDWEAEEFVTTRHIPGSDNNDVFFGGVGVEEVTLSIWFDDRAAYQRFRALRHSTGTLRLLASFTSLGGAVVHELGQDYESFDNVFLRTPRDVRHEVGGVSMCNATFLFLGGA